MLEVRLKKLQGSLNIRADFTVENREILALFGRSGTGKTSIINMLAGLSTPDTGRIRLNDNWIYNSYLGINAPPQERRFGYIFQDGRLFPHLTVKANLCYGMKLIKPEKRRFNFDEIVSLLEIDHLLDRRPAKLSGGEKQRVAIGRSLLMSPNLLLMDEPLSSLDDTCKQEILPFVLSIAEELSIPIVYVSHSAPEIEFLTTKVITLEDGRTRPIDREPAPFPKPRTGKVIRGSFPQSA